MFVMMNTRSALNCTRELRGSTRQANAFHRLYLRRQSATLQYLSKKNIKMELCRNYRANAIKLNKYMAFEFVLLKLLINNNCTNFKKKLKKNQAISNSL